jgi:hypothetical protein
MIGGLTWSVVRRDLRVPIVYAALSTGLVLLVEGFQNLGAHLTGAVLYFTLIQTAYRGSQEQGKLERGSVLLLALVIASLAALKGTFFIFTALFVMSWYGLRMLHSPRFDPVRELSLVGFIASVLLLPWMWQQYLSGGTPFYPLLGKGYLFSGPGFDITSDTITSKLKAVAHSLLNGEFIPAVLGLFLLARNPFAGHAGRWHVWGASLCGAAVGSMFLSYHLGEGTGTPRYCQPFLYAALIPVGLGGFFSTPSSKRGTALALCLASFVGNQSGDETAELYTRLHELRRFVAESGRPVSDDRGGQQIKKAQASIPEGARILVGVQNGAELDFGRNPIWHLNHMGMVSPPPGIPVAADRSAVSNYILKRTPLFPVPAPSEQVLGYLRQVGIDFLILQRGEDCYWSLHEQQDIDEKPMWNRQVQTIERLVYREMLGLMKHCIILYDDGDMVVLDLRPRSAGRDHLLARVRQVAMTKSSK